MIKIFKYELRRMVFSKHFFGLAAVCLFFGWNVLNTVTIQGVALTAPFSPRSFGDYLLRLGPLLLAALGLFLWDQWGGQAKKIAVLAAAASLDERRYRAAKCGAAVTVWLLLAELAAALGFAFLAALFGSAVPWGALLVTAGVLLLPVPTLLLTVMISRKAPKSIAK